MFGFNRVCRELIVSEKIFRVGRDRSSPRESGPSPVAVVLDQRNRHPPQTQLTGPAAVNTPVKKQDEPGQTGRFSISASLKTVWRINSIIKQVRRLSHP